MIVPDKTTEKLLNKPADSAVADELCRHGVLPRTDFLRAVALVRKSGKWKKRFRLFLNIFGDACLIFGAFLLFLNHRLAFARVETVCVLFVLFCVCEFIDAPRARFAASVTIGALVFSAAEAFGDGGFLYNRLFVWAGLVLLNEAADLKPRLSPVLLNAAFAAWIVQSPFVGTLPFFAGWIAANVALAALFLFRKRIKFR